MSTLVFVSCVWVLGAFLGGGGGWGLTSVRTLRYVYVLHAFAIDVVQKGSN